MGCCRRNFSPLRFRPRSSHHARSSAVFTALRSLRTLPTASFTSPSPVRLRRPPSPKGRGLNARPWITRVLAVRGGAENRQFYSCVQTCVWTRSESLPSQWREATNDASARFIFQNDCNALARTEGRCSDKMSYPLFFQQFVRRCPTRIFYHSTPNYPRSQVLPCRASHYGNRMHASRTKPSRFVRRVVARHS
jgi:hypothetical protein